MKDGSRVFNKTDSVTSHGKFSLKAISNLPHLFILLNARYSTCRTGIVSDEIFTEDTNEITATSRPSI